jgi:hypothetical protein
MNDFKKKFQDKKFIAKLLIIFTIILIFYFLNLSYKISYYEHTPNEISQIFKENKRSTHTSVNNNKTDVYIQFTGSDSGSDKPIILGYFKINKKVYVIAASKFQLSSNGGFAIMETHLFTFTVNGEYDEVKVINL